MAVYTPVDKSTSFFTPFAYTGDDTSPRTITDLTFEPDIVWIKNRTSASTHSLNSTVPSINKTLRPDTNNGIETDAAYGYINAVTSTGWTMQDGSSGASRTNQSPHTYMSWNWKAGTTSGIGGSPSITPTSYSFNATSKCSIIEYTGNGTSGATIPHGLGVKPACIIIKKTNTTEHWAVYNQGMDTTAPEDYYMQFNGTGNRYDNTAIWNDTAPDTTLITLGNDSTVNTSAATYSAFCFAEVQGFSRFGSYLGNANADGPFINTGFKPSFIIIKQGEGSGTYGWYMWDNKRVGYNPDNEDLLVNTNAVEDDSNNYIDLFSNGFKIMVTGGNVNTDGSEYVYMAFGQSIVGSNGVCATGR